MLASCQAATLPLAGRRRASDSRLGWVVLTVRAGRGALAVVVAAAAAVGKGLAAASRPSPARAIRRECFMEGG